MYGGSSGKVVSDAECGAAWPRLMLRLGETRSLPGHSSIGSISARKQLQSGVPPPTTESNKEGSVPVIWQIPGTALTWSTPRI
ncbi:uncharacterized protein TNCV_3379561 [Trichonephila clavipes]|nr:uncharacterized protein TNCV_3379561 [Trichonephila clavipes]